MFFAAPQWLCRVFFDFAPGILGKKNTNTEIYPQSNGMRWSLFSEWRNTTRSRRHRYVVTTPNRPLYLFSHLYTLWLAIDPRSLLLEVLVRSIVCRSIPHQTRHLSFILPLSASHECRPVEQTRLKLLTDFVHHVHGCFLRQRPGRLSVRTNRGRNSTHSSIGTDFKSPYSHANVFFSRCAQTIQKSF